MLNGINTSLCNSWNEQICSEQLQLLPHFTHYSLHCLHTALLKCTDAFYISPFVFSSCYWNNRKSSSKFIFLNSKFFLIVDSSLLLPCPQTKEVILTLQILSILPSLFYWKAYLSGSESGCWSSVFCFQCILTQGCSGKLWMPPP